MKRICVSFMAVVLVVGVMAGATSGAETVSVPETRAATTTFRTPGGTTAVIEPGFPIDHVGVSWLSGRPGAIRFLIEGEWTEWVEITEEPLPRTQPRRFSSLLAASDAAAYQLDSPGATSLRAVAIDTTAGPTRTMEIPPRVQAAQQPPIVSRAEWGADEDLRFENGEEIWGPPTFFPTRKLIVHHTDTTNDEEDPEAVIRAIYHFHTVERGWGDIGYNFLIDRSGRIYKGRYSGPDDTRNQDTLTGENPDGLGVTGAHTKDANSGSVGIAVLGNYQDDPIPEAAVDALVDHLAWEAERHDIDPRADDPYTNPISGESSVIENISGHRDWRATICPGQMFYDRLPEVRDRVAERVGPQPEPEPQPSEGSECTITGTDGDDVLEGTEGADVICGLRGDDVLLGAEGNDLLKGGRGADSLRGGVGDDLLKGYEGGDVLRGSYGRDELRGGGGRDFLKGGYNNDVLKGHGGKDDLRGGGGRDELRGHRKNDRLIGNGGDDNLFGNKGFDTIQGGKNADFLGGGSGRDAIYGGGGHDDIKGYAGDDFIDGSRGHDACDGGSGNNTMRNCEV